MALSVYDSELLALVIAATKWSQYLLGRHFVVKTDQKALKYLLEQKIHTDSQLYYHIEYKKGVENKVADALSRMTGAQFFFIFMSSADSSLLQEIQESWQEDMELKNLITHLQQSSGSSSQYTWVNNQLRRKGKLLVGRNLELRKHIISLWHSTSQSGHSGIEVTTKRVLALFYLKGIRKDA